MFEVWQSVGTGGGIVLWGRRYLDLYSRSRSNDDTLIQRPAAAPGPVNRWSQSCCLPIFPGLCYPLDTPHLNGTAQSAPCAVAGKCVRAAAEEAGSRHGQVSRKPPPRIRLCSSADQKSMNIFRIRNIIGIMLRDTVNIGNVFPPKSSRLSYVTSCRAAVCSVGGDNIHCRAQQQPVCRPVTVPWHVTCTVLVFPWQRDAWHGVPITRSLYPVHCPPSPGAEHWPALSWRVTSGPPATWRCSWPPSPPSSGPRRQGSRRPPTRRQN